MKTLFSIYLGIWFTSLVMLTAMLVLLTVTAKADASPLDITKTVHESNRLNYAEEDPSISILQGSDKTTSVIVVTWPDGVVDKLVYKNAESDRVNEYGKWLNDRSEEYKTRNSKKATGIRY